MYELYKEANLDEEDMYPYAIRNGDKFVWASVLEMQQIAHLKEELRRDAKPWVEMQENVKYLAEDESFENLCATALMLEMLDD